MTQNGNLKTLQEQLKQKVTKERQKTEEIFNESFQILKSNLLESSKKELTTIERAIKTQVTELSKDLRQYSRIFNKTFRKKMILTSILGVVLIIGMSAAFWGVMEEVASQLKSTLIELRTVQSRINEQYQTLETLQKDTFGIHLIANEDGRFIVIPEKYRIETKWSYKNREAIKLIRKN